MSYSAHSHDHLTQPATHAGLPSLPVQLTSFVGREPAIAEIVRLFANARLVTLTGPGGCGKTRLALRVAPLLSEGLRNDVAWVDLASLTDASLIPQSIARAMNVIDVPGRPLIDAVIAALRTHGLLLVLDNGEHVIGPLAEIAERLLMNCPGLYLLVTSREPLNIPGETAWNVPPLTLPTSGDRVEDLAQSSEAVRLFVDRARSTSSGFELTPSNAHHVSEICRRLDGMPLAIELAASRMNVLDAAEIARRLEQSFHMLTAGRRTALPRHQTLQATIDWSHDLLSDQERVLFARLSVFAGGFTMNAAEEICAGEGLPATEVLELLAHLADKSLIVVDRRGPSTRYRLLQTIRQYSREKLAESGDEVRVRIRHSHWCASLAESGSELEAAHQAEWVDRFEAEHDNFRAAMQWAIDTDDGETAGRIASALWRFWLMRGYLREGRRWLGEAASLLPVTSRTRVGALLGEAVLTCHQADYALATALFLQAREISTVLDERNTEGEILYGLATTEQFQGLYDQAGRHFEESLPLFEHTRGRALSLMGLAMTLLYLGDVNRADAMCRESLALCRQVSDDRSIAGALTSLGIISMAQGNVDQAEEVCRESLNIRRHVGDRGGEAHTLTVLGGIALERSDIERASRNFREALSLRREMGDTGALAGPLEGLAAIDIRQGRADRGVRTMAAAISMRDRHETPPSPVELAFRDRYLAIARERLNQAAFDGCWAEGRAAHSDQVITEALAAAPPPADASVASPASDPAEANVPKSEPLAPELEIHAFGTTGIVRNGDEIPASDWTYTKSRELVLFLLCMGARTKEQIGLALWPDASDTQLRSAFHSTLHHARRALGDPGWIVFRNGTYAFNRSRSFSYDVGAFEQEASRGRRLASNDRVAAIEVLERGIERYQGKYLADLAGAEWHVRKQEELQRQLLDSLLLLGDLLIAEARFKAAAEVYRRAIALTTSLRRRIVA